MRFVNVSLAFNSWYIFVIRRSITFYFMVRLFEIFSLSFQSQRGLKVSYQLVFLVKILYDWLSFFAMLLVQMNESYFTILSEVMTAPFELADSKIVDFLSRVTLSSILTQSLKEKPRLIPLRCLDDLLIFSNNFNSFQTLTSTHAPAHIIS